MQIKNVNDYIEILCKKYPTVPKSDIKKILNFGWKSVYLHNSYGGDTIIRDKNLWCYCGHLKSNSLKYFTYYIQKLIIKLRVLFKRKKMYWDGYYYFALTEPQYQNYLNQQKKRGRKRKVFNYGNQILYKLEQECRLARYGRKYIFRVPLSVSIGFTHYMPNYTTDRAELVEIRDTLKFKDVLVTNNDYLILNG